MNNIFEDNYNNFSLDMYGDSSNPHVVFFGGWGVSSDSYQERLSLLSEHFYIYGISLPGFGDNEPLELKNNDIKGHADFFSEFVLPRLDISDKIVLMGHSTGAGVATLIAGRHLEIVEKLVLVSPVGSPDPLNRSFVRMLNSIDLREALKYSTAQYWRRALPNMRLGVDAKYINLVPSIEKVISEGVDVFIFISEDDRIAPPGSLATITEAKIFWVEGGHSWFKNNPEDLLTSMIDIIYPNGLSGEVKEPERLTLLEFMYKIVVRVCKTNTV